MSFEQTSGGAEVLSNSLSVAGVESRRILIVDDEPGIVEVISAYLRADGFEVDTAADGDEALLRFAENPADLILLDLTLPKRSGLEIFRILRETSDVPVIMVTSRTAEVDCVVGLELGADDYVSKPFSPRELVARVRTVLRRGERTAKGQAAEPSRSDRRSVFNAGDLEIDHDAFAVRCAGVPISLTRTEFRILDELTRQPGRTFTRAHLLDLVRDDADIFDRTLDRHVANLRKKIQADPSAPRYIVTVFGVGYRFMS
ncbi:MAG: response regulator transcription factor [Candidatus Velthaea sp.]